MMKNKHYVFAAFLFLVAAFFAYREYRTHQSTTHITGHVTDKETGKPVPYALLKMAVYYDNVGPREGKTVVANEKGEYELVSKNVPEKYADIRALLEGRDTRRGGQGLSAWFPGYRKWGWSKDGWKLYRGKLDIALERPQSAEEAVRAFDNAGAGKGNLYIIYEKAKLKESTRIINRYPNTTWADKVYMNFFAGVEEKLADDIRNYYTSFSCEFLLRNKDLCLSDRKKWINS